MNSRQTTGGLWNIGKQRRTAGKKQRGERVCEPCTEDFEGQGSESNRRRWQERPLLGGHSTGMGQAWERVQHKPETKHFQLFCWEFSIASFTVRSTEAGEREGETEGGRRETAEVVSSYTALVFPGGPRSASTVSSLYWMRGGYLWAHIWWQSARPTDWPLLYNWTLYIYTLRSPPQSHCRGSAPERPSYWPQNAGSKNTSCAAQTKSSRDRIKLE